MRPAPLPVGPGQESVWDYPRPPRLEPTARHLVIRLGGAVLADTRRGYRVLETSHPPVYYFPPADVDGARLVASPRGSSCEWKGQASYRSVVVDPSAGPSGPLLRDAAWLYPAPSAAFAPIAGYLAFYCLDGRPELRSIRAAGPSPTALTSGLSPRTPRPEELQPTPGPMDGCFVDDERVTPQPGGFYGGWITRDVVGPWKGEPGTGWW